MRIDRIRIGAFGRIADLDTGPESLERLVVVLGPNEAGKSTLFTFLTTALYGFQPATRERNPHVPWGSEEASGSVRLHLEGDGCAEIERTLRSQPTGRLTVDGRTTDVRNQAVPWVGHVPRAVFRQVFAITLSELAGLDGETWARIQDKVIGAMGAADLLSARAVAEALEREAGEIWRPNRRGNQRLRDLQATIRELRGRRGSAQERDTRIRRLVDEREAVRAELGAVRERRHLDRAEIERARSLLPVKRQLERIAALRHEGGPAELLHGFPPDPVACFAELLAKRRALEEEREATAHELREREGTIAQATALDSRLLAGRDEIAQLVARAAGCAPDRVRAVELEGEVEDVEARLDVAAARILTGPWRDVPADALTGIPVELIRERVARERQGATRPASAPPTARNPITWLALLAGAALLLWGLSSRQGVATALGAATIAAALTWWLTRARIHGVGRTGERHGTGSARSQSSDDLATLLARLPVSGEHLSRPSEGFVAGLERLREFARQRGERTRALEAACERVHAVDVMARDLARALRRNDTGNAESIARELQREVRDGERLQDAAASAEREARRLRAGLDGVIERIRRLDADIAALSERAEALTPGSTDRGLEEARSRLAAHERAERLDDELRRSHPDLEQLREQIDELDRGEHTWSVDEDALARTSARIEAHDEHIEELLTHGEALDGEVARLRDLETVDAVDSEIASLKEQEAGLTRERDRKWVVARLLREADRRFREEHQPDLVRRAGSYLEHLTGGRYHRLIVDETVGDHLFYLVGPTLPAPVPLSPPVSTGTLEQAYLSLRLAIVDHLDQGGEKLPLFVDEIFVNWDGERRVRGLEVLARISGTRQVFVFTCHPAVAAELQDRGARVLTLDRPG